MAVLAIGLVLVAGAAAGAPGADRRLTNDATGQNIYGDQAP